jgi:hypothetical protein
MASLHLVGVDSEQGKHLCRGNADGAPDAEHPGRPGPGLDRLIGAAAADAEQAGSRMTVSAAGSRRISTAVSVPFMMTCPSR